MWNRNEQNPNELSSSDRPNPAPPRPAVPPASKGRKAAVIGASIAIRGDLTGEEDLVIEGRVEGEVTLSKHRVEVGQGGRVKADIHAKTIHVLGQVDGNLAAEEEVVIRASGRVAGNIAAARVTLEDGCNFRGNVDMSPGKKKLDAPRPSDVKRRDGERKNRPAHAGEPGANRPSRPAGAPA